MSELKNEITEVTETVEAVENNEEVEINDDNNFSDITEDDYYTLKERLSKAESTIVKYKKNAKKTPESSDWEVITKKDLELIRFIDKNPEYEWKDEELKSYMKKWLSITEAKKLVTPDETTTNRAKTKSSSIAAWEQWWTKAQYSTAELEKMSQSEFNRVTDLIDSWKAVVK